MHRYEVFETSAADGAKLSSIGKTIELNDDAAVVKTVLNVYGFTQYIDCYKVCGHVGDIAIKVIYCVYNRNEIIHWVLKKV